MANQKSKRLFVTVGTTKFDSLIEKITSDDTLEALGRLGFTHLSLQVGNGNLEAVEASKKGQNVPSVSYFRLKNSIAEDIAGADLVISHAGSGSVLDCLDASKNLLVVINDELMDNHQVELAEKLAQEGFLHYCFVPDIVKTLSTVTWSSLKPFQAGKTENFAHYLEERLGFVES